MKTLGTIVFSATFVLLPWCGAYLASQTAIRATTPATATVKAFLGIEEDADEDPQEPGLTVQVVCGSAAAKAGLRTNDVLLKLDEQPLSAWADVSSFMQTHRPGDRVRLTYRRAGKKSTAQATLTAREAVECEKKGRGFLGVSAGEETELGVSVTIVQNSGAAKAGLQDGDVLVRLNNTAIRDGEDITDFMAETAPNDRVRVTYHRAGKEQTTLATLGEQKAWDWKEWNQPATATTPEAEKPALTVTVREKAACLGVYTETNSTNTIQRGAEITDFTEESAAQAAQLTVGDVIISVNGQRVRSHEELWNEIAKYQPSDQVIVEYLRGEQPLSVAAQLNACRNKNNEVNLQNTDAQGNNEGRQFYLFDFDDTDRQRLRERQVITIHKGAEGDAEQLPPTPAPTADNRLILFEFRAEFSDVPNQLIVEFDTNPQATIVSLYDHAGRQLFREEMNAFNGHYQQRFDLSEYAGENLQLRVQQGEKVFFEKIEAQ